MKPSDAAVYAWRRTNEPAGHSIARVERAGAGWRFDGAEVLTGPSAMSCQFTVFVGGDWLTQRVDAVAFDAAGAHRFTATADADRHWTVDSVAVRELDGATDVDIAATPLTNTFPIRRLGDLSPEQERTFAVAWVDVPSLRVHRVEQTYRRLPDEGGRAGWEYRDDAHGRFRLFVDGDGVVTDYEGFAVRVAV